MRSHKLLHAKQNRFEVLIGGILGLCFFYCIIGGTIFNPQHISWLLQPNSQDCVQHFVGWEFFRNEPWHLPLGLILHYGAPYGTSIVYTDSIPLFALFFKCIRHFLPLNFQYFGLWFVLCFFLQGLFGWVISSYISQRFLLKIIMTCFFLLSPIMLNRVIEHQALAAHWVLLASIVLYIKPYDNRSNYYWLALNIVTLLIHAYLALMVLCIWIAFLIDHIYITRSMTKRAVALQVGIYSIASLIVAWLSGYFILSISHGIEAGGFIFNSMNLFSPFVPTSGSSVISGNWSRFLYPLSVLSSAQSDEGFSYFGLGMVLLIGISMAYGIIKISSSPAKKWLPLMVMSCILFVYSLSSVVGFGSHILLNYSLPSQFTTFTEIFRNPARFFWPVYYLIMVMVFIIINKAPRKLALGILSIALSLQIIDLYPKLYQFNLHFRQTAEMSTDMKNSFWDKAAKKYTKLAFLPIVEMPHLNIHHFQNYIYFASTHNMSVNNGYFARYDKPRLKIMRNQLIRQISQGDFDSDTLYIVTDTKLIGLIKSKLKMEDKIFRLGSYYIIAPGWQLQTGLANTEKVTRV